ncbi:BCCT family transporter [Kushneria phyllosphaerae]|uniref:Glycine betaine/proline betaine transporter BetS n=1 Tax=Kushneria phyllosphaerae TaxID=2100822 RepID=A0A2R8CJN2_9GAMM|nr:BCCT family transporter [Kushneria phyllosphaerae]SPJ33073.1 Glycine betaine/proline betaine transporter BetS [Kushneria phyllosphaerae]
MAQEPENEKKEKASDAGEGIPAPTGDSNLIDTDYVIGQDNFQGRMLFNVDLHGKVFGISSLLVLVFVVLTLTMQSQMEPLFNGMRDWLTANLSWFFMLSTAIFVILAVGLIFSPLGKVRLGGAEAKPDHTYISWFAMLFAAGMGIGLMFYGVSEPISHYTAAMGGTSIENGVRVDSAPLDGAMGDETAARQLGMASTMLHWGLHPWAIYAMVALSLALFSFNKGLPLTMRSIFYPVLGERIWGWPGHIVDILAVFSTLFGLATSLGLGAQQAAAGLHFLFDVPDTNTTRVILIVAITAVTLCSVAAGVNAGLKHLSELNMGLAFALLLFILFTGPTLDLVIGFFNNIWAYITYLPELSMPFGREDVDYSQSWSAFYWAWWISWSPFVGMFIARVSRGRTVREFLIAVLLVPTLVCILWMTVFGGAAIFQVDSGMQGVADAALELKLFVMLGNLPWSTVTSLIGLLLIMVFFITSADSGSLVIDTITAGGKIDAPTSQRLFWALISGVIAIALLLGGGLGALQAMVICTGLPFAVVLLVGCFGVIKGLMSEPRAKKLT